MADQEATSAAKGRDEALACVAEARADRAAAELRFAETVLAAVEAGATYGQVAAASGMAKGWMHKLAARAKALRPRDAPANTSLRLPVTVNTSGSMESFVGRVFRYEGRAWTVTSGWGTTVGEGWPAPRFWIAEYPDGSGERREVTLDELAAMLDA